MSEEELLKKMMLVKLQRKLLASTIPRKEKETIDFKKIFLKNLTQDGLEMFNRALKQYPAIAEKIAESLGRLYNQGRLKGSLNAEAVYGIFLELGYPIRLDTRIVYKKKGKVKSISELLKEKD